MSGIEAIGAVSAAGGDLGLARLGAMPAMVGAGDGASFASILQAGMHQVEGKIATANDLVRRFAVDDSVPLHKVTYALEEARLSVELAMQVRGRLLDSYRELMNMQL